MIATFDISGQFGGRDAAQVAMPHFRALKAAAKTAQLRSFPSKELAFILRVDGEVNEYGLSGAGNVDVDSNGEYVSVDIGCSLKDRDNLETIIADAIAATPRILQDTRHELLTGVDFGVLAEDLAAFIAQYRQSLAE